MGSFDYTFAVEALIILGIILSGTGLMKLVITVLRLKNSRNVKGIVTEVKSYTAREHGRAYQQENPVVSYLVDGKEYSKEIRIKKESGIYYQGQTVELAVMEKKNGHIVLLKDENTYFVKAYALIFLGIIAVISALVVYSGNN